MATAKRLLMCLFLLLILGMVLFGCGGQSSLGSQSGDGGTPQSGVSFASPKNIASGGTHAGSLVIADFNGDGKLDIAVSNFSSNTIAIFLNRGAGTFASPKITTVQIPNGLGAIATGDFNEDGKPDLIVATIAGPQVDLVLLGNGDGTFTQAPTIPNSFGFLRGRVADLNGDKHSDFIGCSNGNIHVALGNGDGSFQPVSYLPNGPMPDTYFGCDVGDFNGDGKIDILGADSFTSSVDNVVLFAGNGDGTFQSPTVISSGSSNATSISVADFNGDNKLDALVGFQQGVAALLLGNGDGSFQTPVPVSGYGELVLAADLNHDGKPDALAANGVLSVALNAGNGTFGSRLYTFALPAGLSDLAAGDLNGDGLPDIALVNSDTDQLTILLSQK